METNTKTLEHRAWEGRLVGCSVDSKSFRVYNSSKSVRERRNLIFIETPSVLPEPDMVSGFDEGALTYDDYDMVRDVRNYTSRGREARTEKKEKYIDDSVAFSTLLGFAGGVYEWGVLSWRGAFPRDITAYTSCLLYTSPSPRDKRQSRMPSSA